MFGVAIGVAMPTQKQLGAGAIGAGAIGLASIVFSNLDTTRQFLDEAVRSGGLPKMLAELVLNPAFQVIVIAVAVALGGRAFWMAHKTDSNTGDPTKPQFKEIVRDKHFINEPVDLDWKLFDNCTFQNVSFWYDGKGPTAFLRQRFVGNFKINSRNAAARAYAKFMLGFPKMDGFLTMQRIKEGPNGQFVSAGPSIGPEGRPEVLAELSIRYVRLVMYLNFTALVAELPQIKETASRVEAIRRDIYELAKNFLPDEDAKPFEGVINSERFRSRDELVGTMEGILDNLLRLCMKLETAENRAKNRASDTQ